MAVQAQEWKEIGGVCDYHQPVLPLNQRSAGFFLSNESSFIPHLASSPSMGAAQFQRQKDDGIDSFIALQNERLRLALQQQRNQQLVSLMRMLESKALVLLQQKEEDISKANSKTMELEECLRRVEAENETWQRIARENEAMAVALSNTLEQVRETTCCSNSAAEDAESCCDSPPSSSATRRRKRERRGRSGGACRACNTMDSCVLLLPCRHLCACKSCEAFMDFCPVCKSVKKASIEVYMN